MTVRGTLLALALALFAAPAVAQKANPGEVRDQDIQELQQQLAALSAMRGMKPEEAEKLLKQFQQWQKNGGGNWADFAKQNPLPRPADRPPPPVIQPPPPPPPDVNPRPNFQPQPPPQPRPFDLNNPPRPNPNNFIPDQRPANPDAEGMMKFWEQNVGNLDDTPAVREAILDLFNQGPDGAFGGGDWKDFLDDFNKNGGNNEGFGDWLKEMNPDGGKWDMPDMGGGGGWDFPKWNWGGGWGGGNNGGGGGGGNGGGWNWGGGGGGGGFSGGGGGSWLPVILLVVFVAAGLIAWKLWPMFKNRESAAAQAVRAINNWPVDPRTIRSREELVKAFEYLSVLLCGDAARVWNHETIARALRRQIPASELVADELAKLYELARYTPAGEPLPPSALADARRCLCHLAGVSA